MSTDFNYVVSEALLDFHKWNQFNDRWARFYADAELGAVNVEVGVKHTDGSREIKHSTHVYSLKNGALHYRKLSHL